MRQNITLSLEGDLIRQVKVLAAQKGTSVSGLLRGYIEGILSDEAAYESARQHALALMDRGFHLGGTVPATRDEWHER